MHAGKHMDYERKLVLNFYRSRGVTLSSEELSSLNDSE